MVLSLHFDGVILEDTIGPQGSRVSEKKDRLNIILKSPLVEKPQFVASQVCPDGTGSQVATQACQAVEDLGVMNNIWVVVYDTTASNSSPVKGAAALVEQHRGCQILKAPCRNHIMDLFGKKLVVVVLGQKSTGPTYPLFSRYAKEWPSLYNSVDYSKLKKLDCTQW